MLDVRQFTKLVIVPALETLEFWSPEAERLVLGTAIQESKLRYLQQLGNGPALGLFQMEPATHDDIHRNFLAYRPEIMERLRALNHVFTPAALAGNAWYAAAMCRIHYYRVPDPLPAVGDIKGQAEYWAVHYNTRLGKGTADDYLKAWERYACKQ